MDTNIKSNKVSDNKEKKVETSASSISTSSTTEAKSNINTSQNSASKVSSTVIPSNTKECKIKFIVKDIIYFSDIGKPDFKYSMIK